MAAMLLLERKSIKKNLEAVPDDSASGTAF
jgi:hypothetical protein